MKRRTKLLLSGLVVIGCVLALLGWALTSELALHWTLERLSAASAGRLVVENARRTGVAAMTAERIRFRDRDIAVDAHDIDITVSAVSLLRWRPVVRRLRFASLEIRTGPGDAEPPRLPTDIRLPGPIVVESVRVDRLRFVRAGDAIEVGNIDFGIAYDGKTYALSVGGVDTPWSALSGTLRLGDIAPFPLEGALRLTPPRAPIGPIAVALAGNLQALGIGAVGTVYGADVRAQAALRPFDPGIVAVLSAGVAALDAQAIDPGLPQARLSLGLHATLGRDGRTLGAIHVINSVPGLLAKSRVPVAVASAAFQGTATTVELSDIAIEGRAGSLAGRARVEPGRMAADLNVRRLDLSALDSRMHATALAGPLHVETDWKQVSMRLAFAQAGIRIALNGAYRSDVLELHEARWTGAAGSLTARGTMQTAKPYAFQASGTLIRLDPARLGAFPSASLNGDFMAKGEVDPLSVALALKVADSRFRGQPFAAEGRLRVLPDRIADVDVGLRLGTARGRAQGSLGAAGNTLTWSLAVPDMRVVDPAARGRLQARGAVHGTWREPGVDFEIEASELRWGERARAARVSGTGRLAQGPSGRFDLAVDVQSLGLRDLVLDRARAIVDGTREAHRGRLESASGAYRFEASLSGALDPGPVWRGRLQSLQLQGPVAARIERAVDVEVGASAARVGTASLQLGAGRIELSQLEWQAPNRLATRGLISNLALATLQPLVPVPEAARALVLGARWDLDVGESLRGSLSIARESGDIVLPGSPAVPAKLRSASLEVQAQGPEIVFRAEIDSAAFGSLEAKGTTRASVRDAIWGIAGDAPLDVSLGARMPSLEWAKPLLADRVTLAGRAALDLRIHGTVSQPEYGGEVSATELRLGVPDLGLTLHDGTVRARFDGQKLAITAVRFVSGTGEINGRGEASLAPGNVTARVDLEAAKLAVLSRPDRLVVLSGRTALTWDRSQLKAEGKLTADRGLIELPPQDTPRPSGDVIVLGAKPQPDRTIGIHADLMLDLGNAFELRGRGVSTRLTGSLRAQLSPEGGPALTGTVRAVDGTYTAFGQKLAIQRAALTFAGPVDNPALDILAVRKTGTVEVGVAVGGTALVPQVRLVSTPPMSDADKLSWLTLGRGLSQAGGNEAAVLQAAASALLSRGTSASQGTFPGRVGLDELSVTKESTTGEQIVTLGKRFASNVYLGFEQGVTGAVSVVKVTYDLSRRWSVQARAGTEHAVDVFYTLGFR